MCIAWCSLENAHLKGVGEQQVRKNMDQLSVPRLRKPTQPARERPRIRSDLLAVGAIASLEIPQCADEKHQLAPPVRVVGSPGRPNAFENAVCQKWVDATFASMLNVHHCQNCSMRQYYTNLNLFRFTKRRCNIISWDQKRNICSGRSCRPGFRLHKF